MPRGRHSEHDHGLEHRRASRQPRRARRALAAAFAVAADALRVASGCRESLGFAARELDERKGRLVGERDITLRLLAAIAAEEHVSIHCGL